MVRWQELRSFAVIKKAEFSPYTQLCSCTDVGCRCILFLTYRLSLKHNTNVVDGAAAIVAQSGRKPQVTRDVQAVTILTGTAAAGVVDDISSIKSLNTVPPSLNQTDGPGVAYDSDPRQVCKAERCGIVSQDASAPIPFELFAFLPSLARSDIVGIPTS